MDLTNWRHSFEMIELAERAATYSTDPLVDAVHIKCYNKKEADTVMENLHDLYPQADMNKIVIFHREPGNIPWIEARHIGEWWIKKVRERADNISGYHSIEITQYQIGTFIHVLAETIFRSKQFPVTFGTAYGPDAILAKAADAASIPHIVFPIHTMMKVQRNRKTRVAYGYRSPFVDLRKGYGQ